MIAGALAKAGLPRLVFIIAGVQGAGPLGITELRTLAKISERRRIEYDYDAPSEIMIFSKNLKGRHHVSCL